MRLFLTLALAPVFAHGVWTFLGDDEPLAPVAEGEAPPAQPAPKGPRPAPTTVRLLLTVRTEGSTIPQGTAAGYRWGGDERLRPVDEQGRVSFTDAPTGNLTLLARAPGYETLEQKRYLAGGIPHDAILILKTRKKP